MNIGYYMIVHWRRFIFNSEKIQFNTWLVVSELCNMCLTLSKILKNLMIWSISYHINVIEFGLWSCGLCHTILKSWHLLTNIRKICTSRPGYSDDSSRFVKCVVVFLVSLTVNLYQLQAAYPDPLISCDQFSKWSHEYKVWIPPKVEGKSRKFWNWTTDILNIEIKFWII